MARKIIPFVILTFAISWSLIFITSKTFSSQDYLKNGLPPLGMFIPAFIALVLQIFFFKDSHIHHKRYKDMPRWIFYGFFILVVICGIIVIVALSTNIRLSILRNIENWLIILWTLLIIRLCKRLGEERFQQAGLKLGNVNSGFKFVFGVYSSESGFRIKN